MEMRYVIQRVSDGKYHAHTDIYGRREWTADIECAILYNATILPPVQFGEHVVDILAGTASDSVNPDSR